MKIQPPIALLLAAVVLAMAPALSPSQSLPLVADPPGADAGLVSTHVDLAYERPTQATKLRNYVFDAYRPYPIVGAAMAAGMNQLSNTPPEWRQGAGGFSKRMGSDFAIAAVGTTTRYELAEAFKEDTLYYRCECRGIVPRFTYAAFSTFTARRGRDGHRVFSVPALLAPYAGSFTALYGWYPNRLGTKDAIRIGSYGLLANLGGNVALEFFYSGPHSLLSRIHLNNTHGSPVEGPNK
jgi:hypothetical protein